MGTLLGSPYYQNLGDAPGAIRTLEKAPTAGSGVGQGAAGATQTTQRGAGRGADGAGPGVHGFRQAQGWRSITWFRRARQVCGWRTLQGQTARRWRRRLPRWGLLGDDYSQRGNGTMRDPAKATAIYEQVLALNLRILKAEPGDARSMRGRGDRIYQAGASWPRRSMSTGARGTVRAGIADARGDVSRGQAEGACGAGRLGRYG